VDFSWSVGDTSIAGFDSSTGVLTARRPGTSSLTFSTKGFVPKSWVVQVYAAMVGFDRSRIALRSGQHGKLVASFLDDDNKPATPGTNLTWSSSNVGVARVQTDGTIEAISPGRTVISAVLGDGQPAAAVVFVTGDLLLCSSRSGKSGLYTIAPGAPDDLIPVAADTFSNNIDPTYSPDRTRIAFSSDRFAAGNFDIFVADADGRNPVRLTTDPGLDVQPAWTPDGSHIVFTSSRNGIRQVYVMRFDGTETRQLARVPGGSEDPVVSPDGKRVAFTGLSIDKEARRDIYLVDLSGGVPVSATLTRDLNERLPAFLPSGELVYLLDGKDKKAPSLVLKQVPTGAPPVTLLTSDAPILTIALSSDGERLAWATVRQVDRDKTVLETTLRWRSLTTGAETSVHLLPGEKISSAAF
jgi:Tol biopolymer transport system component